MRSTCTLVCSVALAGLSLYLPRRANGAPAARKLLRPMPALGSRPTALRLYRGHIVDPGPAQGAAQTVVVQELEVGDPSPNAPRERLLIRERVHQDLHTMMMTRVLKPAPFKAKQVALAALGVAKQYVGISRKTGRNRVEEFLAVFGLPVKYHNGQWVPFCAAGVGFAACQAYCQLAGVDFQPRISPFDVKRVEVLRQIIPTINTYYFKPHPACSIMMLDSKKRGTWVSRNDPVARHRQILSGWLVFYNWKGQSTPEHVGIVNWADRRGLHSVEFNTSNGNNSNGGTVAQRYRSYRYVVGYVNTYLDRPAPLARTRAMPESIAVAGLRAKCLYRRSRSEPDPPPDRLHRFRPAAPGPGATG